MIDRRFHTLPTMALATAALAACAQGDDGQRGGNAPIGYELAVTHEAQPLRAERVAQAPVMIDISVAQLQDKLNASDIRLIDVRTDAEVAEGMVPGAEHIALDRFDPAEIDLSDGREVVLYCRSGRRSGVAGERLAAHTGKPSQHLAGGIMAWQAAGNPIATD